jgi:hypothetical protein
MDTEEHDAQGINPARQPFDSLCISHIGVRTRTLMPWHFCLMAALATVNKATIFGFKFWFIAVLKYIWLLCCSNNTTLLVSFPSSVRKENSEELMQPMAFWPLSELTYPENYHNVGRRDHINNFTVQFCDARTLLAVFCETRLS